MTDAESPIASKRIALFAYDCEPGAGSDPGYGWQWLSIISDTHDVDVYTKESNRAALEAASLPANVTIIGVPLREQVSRFSTGTAWFDIAHCFIWLRRATKEAIVHHRSSPYDLVHFVTFSAFWIPGPFYKIGIPIVFGPLTGGEQTHPAFHAGADRRTTIKWSARQFFFKAMMKSPSWQRSIAKGQTVSVAATNVVANHVSAAGAQNVQVFRPPFTLEPELSEELHRIRDSVVSRSAHTYVVSGRALQWKGHQWALRAMPTVLERFPNAKLKIIGDGADMGYFKRLAATLEIEAAVEFCGQISRHDERTEIANASALLFPSERDGGGAILSFAMALGTPIVGFSVGAAPAIVGADYGLAEPGSDPAATLAAGMVRVSSDAEWAADLSEKGRLRTETGLSWDECGQALDHWYETALAL